MKQSNNEIIKALQYFSLFDYPPTVEELYTFCKKRASYKRFERNLGEMVNLNKNYQLKPKNFHRYTLPEYSKNCKNYIEKQTISANKLNNFRFKLYIKLLSLFSQIKLVGLSGSISMMNAREEDDIDLFIITVKNRLFTGRFIALLLAQLLNLRRYRDSAMQFFHTRVSPSPTAEPPSKVKRIAFAPSLHKNKVCLNLFFDERDLSVPKFKRSEYVAHEVLQMKPIINKSQTYEKFLQANLWVLRLFPNAKTISKIQNFKSQINSKSKILNSKQLEFRIPNKIEALLKNLQLHFIKKHRTSEIITDGQLWFHPDDFGKKLTSKKF